MNLRERINDYGFSKRINNSRLGKKFENSKFAVSVEKTIQDSLTIDKDTNIVLKVYENPKEPNFSGEPFLGNFSPLTFVEKNLCRSMGSFIKYVSSLISLPYHLCSPRDSPSFYTLLDKI